MDTEYRYRRSDIDGKEQQPKERKKEREDNNKSHTTNSQSNRFVGAVVWNTH